MQFQMLIQMSGPPGSGKSTLSNLLAKSTQGVVIDHDVLRSFFLDQGQPFYEAARLAYDFQWTLARSFLQQGLTTIIDSPCNFQEVLDRGTVLARNSACNYRYIELKMTDFDQLQHRLQNRKPLRSQRTGICNAPADADTSLDHEASHAQFSKWSKSPARPRGGIIAVDASAAPEVSLALILKELQMQDTLANINPVAPAEEVNAER